MTQQCKRENVRFRSIRWSVATRVHFIRVVKRAGQGVSLRLSNCVFGSARQYGVRSSDVS